MTRDDTSARFVRVLQLFVRSLFRRFDDGNDGNDASAGPVAVFDPSTLLARPFLCRATTQRRQAFVTRSQA
jgi:hypothetical protein